MSLYDERVFTIQRFIAHKAANHRLGYCAFMGTIQDYSSQDT